MTLNSKKKGTIAIGQAIAWGTRYGLVVSVPLNDSQKYDLVIDQNGTLSRVEVKYTTQKAKSGNWVVELRTTGGNQSFHTAKNFDTDNCDYVFITSEDLTSWYIPVEKLNVVNKLTLGNKYDEYKISWG